MPRIRKSIPGVDPKLLIKDAARLLPDPTRRLFLRGGLSVGALTFLTGCDIIDGPSAEKALMKISYFNDRAQAWLFNPNRLAPTYPESAVTRPFPFNAYYPESEAPEVEKDDYALEVGGLVDNKKSWTLAELYVLPEETQITRHIRISATRRRRHAREICLVPLRRGLSHVHRHGDRDASADANDVQIRCRDIAAEVWLPHEGAHPDQARLQESQARDGSGRHQQLESRLLGRAGLQLVQWAVSARRITPPCAAALL
jgi:hypothetical protein